MTLRLNSTGGGFVEIDAPNTASNFSVTMPATAGEIVVANTSGDVDLGGLTVSGSAGDDSVNVDSSGRLLVGTSSAGTGAFSSSLFVVQGVAGFSNVAGFMNLQRGEAATSITANEELGVIAFTDDAANAFAKIQGVADASAGSNDYPGRLVFSTTADGGSSPTERMRISSNGNFNHFTNEAFGVRSARTSSSESAFFINANASSTSTGDTKFIIRADGDVENTNGSYGPISSDERLKQDIVDANSQWSDIKNVRITNFHYKNDPAGTLHLGPIAQELETVSPGLITRRPASEEEIADTTNNLVEGDEVLSFKASILYMKAVKALQEAMERIETLEAKVAALEAG